MDKLDLLCPPAQIDNKDRKCGKMCLLYKKSISYNEHVFTGITSLFVIEGFAAIAAIGPQLIPLLDGSCHILITVAIFGTNYVWKPNLENILSAS